MDQRHLQILLVEDNPADALLLCETLADVSERMRIVHVDRLCGVADHLIENACDAILLDLSLPDSSGLATLERVIHIAPQTPVVVLTGVEDQTLALEAVRKGAQDYLVKGNASTSTLVRAIHYAVDRKRAEWEREIAIEFLRLVNASSDTRQLVAAAVRFFQEQSGCEAVGIRLRDGDDYPFFETHGFSNDFAQLENSLCFRDADCVIQRDHAGNPVLACMCGNVIRGRFDPSKPFFTPAGSFWTNSTTELLASTTEADRQARTRNRCHGEGYESVALVALKSGEQCLGLLQLNDRREGMFNLEAIALWERLSGYLAIALAKTLAEEKLWNERRLADETLRESEHKYRSLFENSMDAIVLSVPNGHVLAANQAACAMFGMTEEEICGLGRDGLADPNDLRFVAALEERSRTGMFKGELSFVRKDGTKFPVEISSAILDGGARSFVILREISERKRAEETLRESEERLRLALQAAGMGWWHLDVVRNELMADDQTREFFGLPATAELSLDLFFSFVVPEDIPVLERQLAEALSSPGDRENEFRIRRSDGAVRWLSVKGRALHEDGSPRHIMGVVQDITERRRHENRISTLARLYAVRSGVNAAIVRTRDVETLYADVCRIVAEAGSFPLVWIGLRRDQKVIPQASWGPGSEYVKKIRVEVQGPLGSGPTGTSIRENRAVINEDFTTNSAAAPWREMALHYGFRASAAFPLRRQGKPVGALTLYAGESNVFDSEQVTLLESLSADLSHALDAIDHERVRGLAEQALRESEARYRNLFTTMNEGFALHELIFDAEGKPCDYRFLEVNSAFESATGLTAADVIGRTVLEFFPEMESLWIERYGKVVLDGESAQFEAWFGPLGRCFQVSAFPTEPGRFAVVFLDITERERAREELKAAKEAAEAASDAKSQFLANISHELRTPMNAILGMVDLALPKQLDPTAREFLRTAKGSADLLLSLLNDLLDSAKIEAGKLELESAPFSLRRVLDQTTQALAVRASEKQISFSCQLPPEVPDAVIGDQVRLRQILLNLAGNGIKFTEKGGVTLGVRVATEWNAGDRRLAEGNQPVTSDGNALIPNLQSPIPSVTLEFSVQDTGVGIPPSDLERVFHPFTQADTSTTRRFGGTGLGLPICSSLVHLMGGRIWVESELGRGSTFHFTVRLPLAEQLPAPQESSCNVLPKVLSTLRLLLVEDNPANQKLAAAILQERGHQVEIAENGEQGLRRAQENAYDVILMDVQMPGMDGLKATQAIRNFERERQSCTGNREAEVGKPPSPAESAHSILQSPSPPPSSRVPILAMTAHAMKGDRERCLAAGMDGYLCKPIDGHELIALVERLATGEACLARLPATKEAAITPVPSVFDFDLALKRCLSNRQLLADMIACFFEETERLFPQIHAALQNGDLVEIGRLGHRLKGTLLYLGAETAREAAARVEFFERHADTQAAAEMAVKTLEQQCEILKSILKQ